MTDIDMPAFEDIDASGTIAHQSALVEEVLAESEGTTRGDFLKKFAVGAGGAALATSALAPATAMGQVTKASARGDLVILNYALTLERLEAAFYTEASRRGKLNKTNAYFSKVVGEHERTHVTAVAATIKKLGGKLVAAPKLDFGNTTGNNTLFQKTALALEETGVPAYLGQAPFILNKDVLLAAARIATVEARHAAWMRSILGLLPAPAAFDARRTQEGTLKVVAGTGFIVG